MPLSTLRSARRSRRITRFAAVLDLPRDVASITADNLPTSRAFLKWTHMAGTVAVDWGPRWTGVLGGMGLAILSTSRGVLSGREARKQKVGGELLAYVW